MEDSRKIRLYDNLVSYIIDIKDHDTDDLVRTMLHIGFTKEEVKEELNWLDLEGTEWMDHL